MWWWWYSFPDIPTGNYSIVIEAAGFRLASTTISVRVNQQVRFDMELEVGATAETVAVTATAASINFDDATQQAGIGTGSLCWNFLCWWVVGHAGLRT